MTRNTVLVVDDDPDLLQLLALRLGAAGYAVQSAESGERALAAMAVSRPDVVVTDLKMGGMAGLALFDAFGSKEKSMHINPGGHLDIPRFEGDGWARFYELHLGRARDARSR